MEGVGPLALLPEVGAGDCVEAGVAACEDCSVAAGAAPAGVDDSVLVAAAGA